MDADFWIKAWKDGRTNFNQKSFNEKLLEFFPQLNPIKSQKVLVPLCGKSVDMLWLQTLGLHVHGFELYEKAVNEFFTENNLQVEIQDEADFKKFTHENIAISCGDYFKLNEIEAYDFVYDRAALVALPQSMRRQYVQVTSQALKPGGKYLLIVYEYDQSQLEGPPFSISEAEVHELYDENFTISLVDNRKPKNEGDRLSSAVSLTQKVYILWKRSK